MIALCAVLAAKKYCSTKIVHGACNKQLCGPLLKLYQTEDLCEGFGITHFDMTILFFASRQMMQVNN
jgi:hypothetical protein